MSTRGGESYVSSESVPKWFIWLGMIVALLTPYVVAFLAVVGPSLLADIGGLFIALLSLPFISIVVIVVAYLWYNNEY